MNCQGESAMVLMSSVDVEPERGAQTMMVRDEYPPGVPCWVDCEQQDPEAAAEFYAGLFGWTFLERTPSDAPVRYLMAQLEDHDVAAVGSPTRPTTGPPGWTTFVTVENLDHSVELVRQHGGKILVEPADVADAGRSSIVTDPDGAELGLWQPRDRIGAEVVNEPGTWNWSDLVTPDPESAAAFYGAVFGWRITTLELGQMTATMLSMPGYAEFLDRLDPSRRERHSGEGVPEGFGDGIGWVRVADEPAHWHVTFAVHDADAVADRAAALGGAVLDAPHDEGPTRVTLLQDPQGASFTASHYRPG